MSRTGVDAAPAGVSSRPTEARRARDGSGGDDAAAEQAEACLHPALAAQRRELMVLEAPWERVPRCARAVRVPRSPVDSASGKFIAAVARTVGELA